MKIGFVGIEGLPPNHGGYETFVDNISKILIKHGHDVSVFQPKYRENDENYVNPYNGINLISVKCSKNKNYNALLKRYDVFLKLKQGEYDYIHNLGIFPFPSLLYRLKTTSVLTFDGFEYNRLSYNFFARYILKINFKNCTKFPNISITDNKIVQEFFYKKGIKIYYLPYGTNFISKKDYPMPEKYKKMDITEDNYFYFVGRFVKGKNIHRLIHYYNKIETDNKLVIIGSDTNYFSYGQYLKKLSNNNKNIIFVGPAFDEDYYSLVSNSKGYVSLSNIEGTSPALLDALGAKKNILVANTPEQNSALNGNGHYVDLRNDDESIKKFSLFFNSELYSEYESKKLQDFTIKNYQWDIVYKKYIKILRNEYEI